jgi:hypothetical protein
MPGVKGKSGGRRNEAAAAAGKTVGRPAVGVRAQPGQQATQRLRVLAAAEGATAEALAARWLAERIAAEWSAYERERGIGVDAPPAEWGGDE